MPEPLRAIPLQYAPPDRSRTAWPWVVAIALVLGALCCGVAWILIVAGQVESVLVTGPIIFTSGLLCIIGGVLLRRRWPVAIGVAHCCICLLFVGLVNIFGWSPSRAREPFGTMGLFYCLLVIPITVVMLVWDRPSPDWRLVDSPPAAGHK